MMFDISVPLHVSCHEIHVPLEACNVHSPSVSGKWTLIGGLEK